MIKILQGDCLEVLATLPANSVHCVVTSPPYWGLRDYGTGQWIGGDPECDHLPEKPKFDGPKQTGQKPSGNCSRAERIGALTCHRCGAKRIDSQLGLEPTLGEHLEAMVRVFEEVRRVLRPDGTLWLNYGDCYATAPNGRSAADTKAAGGDDRTFRDKPFSTVGPIDRGKRTNGRWGGGNNSSPELKAKDLCMVSNRLAIALQEAGWWVRSEIVWHKPNPMPESIKDRPATSHEKVWLLSKSSRYFYDAEAVKETDGGKPSGNGYKRPHRLSYGDRGQEEQWEPGEGRNLRNVWTIATAPFPEAHFATFPPALAERCIKAGTSEKGVCGDCGAPWVREVGPASGGSIGAAWHDHQNDDHLGQRANAAAKGGNGYQPAKTTGWRPSCSCDAKRVPATVLDPFFGSGTSGLVADRLQRDCIGIDLNTEYCEMGVKRIHDDAPLFAEVER